MTTFFEKWIIENNFSDTINDIFSDAVKCYKNGVYRAALMLSFVGMMNVLRDRILRGEMPTTGWVIGEWQKIQKDVTKDDNWEEAVLNAVKKLPQDTQGKISKSPVFSVSPDIRNQVAYWKDRRNDCAHYKSNHIDHYHVEGFWAFLQSNLNKLNIEGGMMSLFNRFIVHYDPAMTPPSSDVTPLVLQIEHSVTEQEIEEFWFKLIPALDPENSFQILDSKALELIETIFINCSGYVKNSLIKRIGQIKSVLIEFITKHPHRIVEFGLPKEKIRQLWRKDMLNSPYRYDVIHTLLNAGLIPSDQWDEVMNVTVSTMSSYDIKKDTATHLTPYGFNKTFEEFFFDKHKFEDYQATNSRASMLNDYIRDNGFSKHIVDILCWEYDKGSFSFTLLHRLTELFKDLPDKKFEFKTIATDNGITIPERLEKMIT